VYFLANQMGTSVKVIEDHYGHITPVKNAERILQGLPGWEPTTVAPQVAAETGRVNADAAKSDTAKKKTARPKARGAREFCERPDAGLTQRASMRPLGLDPHSMRRWRS
jgi:hypothetical protein